MERQHHQPADDRNSDTTAGQDETRQTAAAAGTASSNEQPPMLRTAHGVVRGHVVEAVGLLRERLAEPWTLGSLAEEVHLSRSHLFRCFDATVNMSPMAYLRQMRVQKMAQLLLTTDLSIAEVARAVGWTDPSYATRCFHAAYGVSPTGYRHRQTLPPLD